MQGEEEKPQVGVALAARLPLSQVRTSGKQPVSRITRGKDPERFYCPFEGCNRSFAELWRLKVHYRAPPDVRGSGKERGHGCELQFCPKCGKELRAGKHHVGCFAGRNAPRQVPAKRFKGIGGVRAEGDGEGASDDEVEGQPRRRPVNRLPVQDASEGSEASHPRDLDRKRNLAAVYGREDSPDLSQGRLVHSLQHPRLSPSHHRMLGTSAAAPSDPLFIIPDFAQTRQSPNHSGDRSVSGAAGRSPAGIPSPPPLPPGDDGRPVHYLFDFDLFNPAEPRPKLRDDGTRPVHTVLSNASSGDAGGAYPAPMSDDYIMQIMFGAADVNSMPKRVTSHLHHWDDDVGDVDGFGMMAGSHAAAADNALATNPSSMRGALDTLINYGVDQGPDPETVFLHRIVPLRHYAPSMPQRVGGVMAAGFPAAHSWFPGGNFNMAPTQSEAMMGMAEGGKATSLGSREADGVVAARHSTEHAHVHPHVPASMGSAGMQTFMPGPPPMYQPAPPLHMYPMVAPGAHPGGWSNPTVGQRAHA